jgi:hypothetical protein
MRPGPLHDVVDRGLLEPMMVEQDARAFDDLRARADFMFDGVGHRHQSEQFSRYVLEHILMRC